MDLFDMLHQLCTMTNAFFTVAKTVDADSQIIVKFIEARDRAADLLSKAAQEQELN